MLFTLEYENIILLYAKNNIEKNKCCALRFAISAIFQRYGNKIYENTIDINLRDEEWNKYLIDAITFDKKEKEKEIKMKRANYALLSFDYFHKSSYLQIGKERIFANFDILGKYSKLFSSNDNPLPEDSRNYHIWIASYFYPDDTNFINLLHNNALFSNNEFSWNHKNRNSMIEKILFAWKESGRENYPSDEVVSCWKLSEESLNKFVIPVGDEVCLIRQLINRDKLARNLWLPEFAKLYFAVGDNVPSVESGKSRKQILSDIDKYCSLQFTYFEKKENSDETKFPLCSILENRVLCKTKDIELYFSLNEKAIAEAFREPIILDIRNEREKIIEYVEILNSGDFARWEKVKYYNEFAKSVEIHNKIFEKAGEHRERIQNIILTKNGFSNIVDYILAKISEAAKIAKTATNKINLVEKPKKIAKAVDKQSKVLENMATYNTFMREMQSKITDPETNKQHNPPTFDSKNWKENMEFYTIMVNPISLKAQGEELQKWYNSLLDGIIYYPKINEKVGGVEVYAGASFLLSRVVNNDIYHRANTLVLNGDIQNITDAWIDFLDADGDDKLEARNILLMRYGNDKIVIDRALVTAGAGTTAIYNHYLLYETGDGNALYAKKHKHILLTYIIEMMAKIQTYLTFYYDGKTPLDIAAVDRVKKLVPGFAYRNPYKLTGNADGYLDEYGRGGTLNLLVDLPEVVNKDNIKVPYTGGAIGKADNFYEGVPNLDADIMNKLINKINDDFDTDILFDGTRDLVAPGADLYDFATKDNIFDCVAGYTPENNKKFVTLNKKFACLINTVNETASATHKQFRYIVYYDNTGAGGVLPVIADYNNIVAKANNEFCRIKINHPDTANNDGLEISIYKLTDPANLTTGVVLRTITYTTRANINIYEYTMVTTDGDKVTTIHKDARDLYAAGVRNELIYKQTTTTKEAGNVTAIEIIVDNGNDMKTTTNKTDDDYKINSEIIVINIAGGTITKTWTLDPGQISNIDENLTLHLTRMLAAGTAVPGKFNLIANLDNDVSHEINITSTNLEANNNVPAVSKWKDTTLFDESKLMASRTDYNSKLTQYYDSGVGGAPGAPGAKGAVDTQKITTFNFGNGDINYTKGEKVAIKLGGLKYDKLMDDYKETFAKVHPHDFVSIEGVKINIPENYKVTMVEDIANNTHTNYSFKKYDPGFADAWIYRTGVFTALKDIVAQENCTFNNMVTATNYVISVHDGANVCTKIIFDKEATKLIYQKLILDDTTVPTCGVSFDYKEVNANDWQSINAVSDGACNITHENNKDLTYKDLVYHNKKFITDGQIYLVKNPRDVFGGLIIQENHKIEYDDITNITYVFKNSVATVATGGGVAIVNPGYDPNTIYEMKKYMYANNAIITLKVKGGIVVMETEDQVRALPPPAAYDIAKTDLNRVGTNKTWYMVPLSKRGSNNKHKTLLTCIPEMQGSINLIEKYTTSLNANITFEDASANGALEIYTKTIDKLLDIKTIYAGVLTAFKTAETALDAAANAGTIANYKDALDAKFLNLFNVEGENLLKLLIEKYNTWLSDIINIKVAAGVGGEQILNVHVDDLFKSVKDCIKSEIYECNLFYGDDVMKVFIDKISAINSVTDTFTTLETTYTEIKNKIEKVMNIDHSLKCGINIRNCPLEKLLNLIEFILIALEDIKANGIATARLDDLKIAITNYISQISFLQKNNLTLKEVLKIHTLKFNTVNDIYEKLTNAKSDNWDAYVVAPHRTSTQATDTYTDILNEMEEKNLTDIVDCGKYINFNRLISGNINDINIDIELNNIDKKALLQKNKQDTLDEIQNANIAIELTDDNDYITDNYYNAIAYQSNNNYKQMLTAAHNVIIEEYGIDDKQIPIETMNFDDDIIDSDIDKLTNKINEWLDNKNISSNDPSMRRNVFHRLRSDPEIMKKIKNSQQLRDYINRR